MIFGAEWLDTAPDERTLVHTHPSKWVMFKQLFFAIFMVSNMVGAIFSDVTAGITVGSLTLRGLILLAIPFAFIPVVTAQVRRLATHYVVTERNLWAKKRILARDVDPTVLSRVQSCNYQQGYLDRLLNKGTVRVETAGTGGTDVVLSDIPHPQAVARMIRERIEEHDSTEERVGTRRALG